MRLILILMVVFMVLPSPSWCGDDAKSPAVLHVENYVRKFHESVSKKRANAAIALVPLVVSTCEKHGVDPLLVAIMISFESSWRPESVGARGERGLLQVWGLAAKDYDTKTTDGALEAGVVWLKNCIDKTDTIEQSDGSGERSPEVPKRNQGRKHTTGGK